MLRTEPITFRLLQVNFFKHHVPLSHSRLTLVNLILITIKIIHFLTDILIQIDSYYSGPTV